MQSHRNNPYFCPGHCCESAEWQSKRLIIITMEEQEHVLFIKNMVCNRCILVVSKMLKNLNFNPLRIELGKVVIEEPLKPADRFLIRKALEALGFELLDDKRHRLIEQIRTAIIELVHYENNLSKLKLSEYLSGKCHYDYSLLSKLFSEENGISIEKYYIAQKVERIKENQESYIRDDVTYDFEYDTNQWTDEAADGQLPILRRKTADGTAHEGS